MRENKLDIEQSLTDTLLDYPICFCIDGRRFRITPPSLGKGCILSRLTARLGLDAETLKANQYLEVLRVCHTNRNSVCKVIACATFYKKSDLLDTAKINRRAEFFDKELSVEELTRLFSLVFSFDSSDTYIRHFGIDKERALQKRIYAIKSKTGGVSFGGKSMYGTLIDTACKRYGWTFDYVVWGISFVNLQMLMADAVTSVYLSKEEKKKMHLGDGGGVINADDPNNKELIKAMKWD